MAEITEKQVYEALGLSEQTQEVAEPVAQSPDNTGEQVQEVAEPAEDTQSDQERAEPAPAESQPEEPEQPEPEPDGETLTPEQRRKNAARRRQREQQERQAAVERAVSAAVQAERERQEDAMKAFFQKAGLKNTVTGAPITNMEEFDSWNKQFNEARLQRELKAGKLTQEGLATAIDNHPAIKQAKELVQQEEAAKRTQSVEKAKQRIQSEIDEIHKLDASIGTLEDLTRADYWPELYAMTKRGYSIKDAHFLLNHERLEQAKVAAAKQASMNNARGKDHMTPAAAARGTGQVSVPAADLAMFRQFNPGATDAEIQAYYNKYMRK